MQPSDGGTRPAAPLCLLLIRHGQTAWNAERRVLGRTDIPLDEVGLAQARRLATSLPPLSAVYSSPLSRAAQTARALGDPLHDPDLMEMDQGELDGLDGPSLLARHGDLLERWAADPANVVLPGGETLAEAQARGLRALARIAGAHAAGQTVAVVTHQLLLSAALCGLTGEPLSRWRTFTHRNTAYTVLLCDPTPRVERLHVVEHLG